VSEISFAVSREDADLIDQIVDRIEATIQSDDGQWPRIDATMDITACVANGCPLDLAQLLASDDFTFTHDVCGIYRNIDRKTGKLGDHFVPRTSVPVTS
jgi:hypothetical protein